jgi:hypothetical protein
VQTNHIAHLVDEMRVIPDLAVVDQIRFELRVRSPDSSAGHLLYGHD